MMMIFHFFAQFHCTYNDDDDEYSDELVNFGKKILSASLVFCKKLCDGDDGDDRDDNDLNDGDDYDDDFQAFISLFCFAFFFR